MLKLRSAEALAKQTNVQLSTLNTASSARTVHSSSVRYKSATGGQLNSLFGKTFRPFNATANSSNSFQVATSRFSNIPKGTHVNDSLLNCSSDGEEVRGEQSAEPITNTSATWQTTSTRQENAETCGQEDENFYNELFAALSDWQDDPQDGTAQLPTDESESRNFLEIGAVSTTAKKSTDSKTYGYLKANAPTHIIGEVATSSFSSFPKGTHRNDSLLNCSSDGKEKRGEQTAEPITNTSATWQTISTSVARQEKAETCGQEDENFYNELFAALSDWQDNQQDGTAQLPTDESESRNFLESGAVSTTAKKSTNSKTYGSLKANAPTHMIGEVDDTSLHSNFRSAANQQAGAGLINSNELFRRASDTLTIFEASRNKAGNVEITDLIDNYDLSFLDEFCQSIGEVAAVEARPQNAPTNVEACNVPTEHSALSIVTDAVLSDAEAVTAFLKKAQHYFELGNSVQGFLFVKIASLLLESIENTLLSCDDLKDQLE